MRTARLLLLVSVLAMGALIVQSPTPTLADDPPNACQLCAQECQASFPNDPVQRRRCMLSCECNPPAPGDQAQSR